MNQILTKISKIYNMIIKDIVIGEYQVGSFLNSEKKLCEKYNVSRQTIRSGSMVLKYDGLI
ncbi:MAG: GntR family transcriptional regulator, partial [Proteobacteria bacterium]|nr:GntR family transcriptional regulator [Pseudomonadota bacterium]